MKNNTNTVFVTCSFEGRDKILVQSILDVDEYYGDFRFEYTNQSHKGLILITKKKDEYFAVINNNPITIPIEPTLNPKSLKALLTNISGIFSDQKIYKEKSYKINKNPLDSGTLKSPNLLNKLSPFVEELYQFLTAKNTTIIKVKGKVESMDQLCNFHCLLDTKNGIMYSNLYIDDPLCKNLVNCNSSDFIIEPNSSVETAVSLKYSCSLKVFLWNLGMMTHQKLVDQKYILSDDVIRHVQWPDYGSLPYEKEFLKLNVIISNHQMSYSQLVLQSKVTQSIINRFLNANLLLGYLTFADHNGGVSTFIKSKKSDFLKSVKSYFSKSFSVFWGKK